MTVIENAQTKVRCIEGDLPADFDDYQFCANEAVYVEDRFHDPEAHSSAYRCFEQTYHQLSAGSYLGETSTIRVGNGCSVLFERYNREMDQWGALTDDSYTLFFHIDPAASVKVGQAAFGGNDVVLLSKGGDFDLRTMPGVTYCAISFDAGIITRVLQSHYPDLVENGSLLFPTSVVSDPVSAKLFRQFAATIEASAKQVKSAPVQKGILLGVENSLKSVVADVLAHHIHSVSHRSNQPSNRLDVAFDCRRVLRERKGVDLPIGNLAKQFGVSRRKLEYLFREEFGRSPAAYRKIILLNYLRAALSEEKNRSKTIGDVAAEFSVWSLGQMAKEYKEFFSQLPSETKNRPN